MRFNKASKALVLCDFRTSAQHIAPSPVGVCRIDWVAHFWQLFEDLYVEPAVGKTNSSLWRHNKDRGQGLHGRGGRPTQTTIRARIMDGT